MIIAAKVAVLLAAIGCDLAAPEPSPQSCGGREQTLCPSGQTCEDDPDDDCDPSIYGDRCPGLCESAQCGGLLGLSCDQGQTCADDPVDSCDPKHGGADCIGLCVQGGPSSTGCDEDGRTFVSKDLDLCQQIQFICELGWVHFYNQCGCGCLMEGA